MHVPSRASRRARRVDAQPLQFNHEADETAVKAAPATPAPTGTPTPSGEPPSATPTPTPIPTGTPGPVLAQGDNDCDGDTDSVDALKGLQHVAAIGFSQQEGCPVLGDALPAALSAGDPPDLFGDVDCDDDVDSVDQLKILQSVAATPFTQNEPCTDIGKPF